MIEHNGKKYARVSDILRPFSNFDRIDPQVLSKKASIGTAAHEAIAEDIQGCFPSPPREAMGYVNSYYAWKESLNPIFVQSEIRYYDDEKMITGQIDALINMSTTTQFPTLIDFKTSSQKSKEVWPMQAHLYYYLLVKNNIIPHPIMLFIKLNKNGALPKVFEYVWEKNIQNKCAMAVDSFWKNNKK